MFICNYEYDELACYNSIGGGNSWDDPLDNT